MFGSLESTNIEGLEVLFNRFQSLYLNLKKKGHDLLNYKNPSFEEDFEKFLDSIEELKVTLYCVLKVVFNKH